jgi:hypothetical protein
MTMLPRRILMTVLLTALPVVTCGCPLVAWLTANLAPPPTLKAEYQPPKDKIVLVVVREAEDCPPIEYVTIKYEMAEKIATKLVKHKIAASTVPNDSLQNLEFTREYRDMKLDEIGRKLGADLILCVQIQKFSLKESSVSPVWQGQMSASVMVVDCHALPGQAKLWPTDRPANSGFPAQSVDLQPIEDSSTTYGEKVAHKVAEEMSENVVSLLHDRKGKEE